MSASTADKNLLYGIIALQMDFISRDVLVTAMNAWVLRKQTPLADILFEQRAFTPDVHALLNALVEKHIEQHGNDLQLSLQAVSSIKSVRADLEQIADADVQNSLCHVAVAPGTDPFATLERPQNLDDSSSLRYRVLRPHAKGGLGEIFVARDTELDREVALKEIQLDKSHHPDSRLRFLLEAKITGRLEHPGIVPVYGLGHYGDGRPFYAMRFIRGDSFEQAITSFHDSWKAKVDGECATKTCIPASAFKSLEFRQLLGRLIDICNAIEYAH
jgi:eukaryotic-like serine/threonine-protein kinase